MHTTPLPCFHIHPRVRLVLRQDTSTFHNAAVLLQEGLAETTLHCNHVGTLSRIASQTSCQQLSFPLNPAASRDDPQPH
jgi:hypothetical protein